MKRAFLLLALALALVLGSAWFFSAHLPRIQGPPTNWRYLTGYDRMAGGVTGWVMKTNAGHWLPLTDTAVLLWDERVYWDGVWDESTELLARTKTIANGSFRFVGVPKGQYMVTAEAGGFTRRMRPALSATNAGSARVFFGTAGVRGTVHDAEGEPMSGAYVTLRHTSNGSRYLLQESRVMTDADGAFEITGFPAGLTQVMVSAHPTAPANLPWPQQEITLTLADGEMRVVRVGGPRRLARWSGIVRTSRGARVSANELKFDRLVSGEGADEFATHIEVRMDPEGRFDARFPPGTWVPSLQLFSSWARPIELPPQTIGTEDLEDLVLTGPRLHGSVVDSWSREPRRIQLVARRRPTEFQPLPAEFHPTWSEAGYEFDLLPPGDWTLSAEPDRLAVECGEFQLHIDADEADRRLDLEVFAP